MVLKHKYGYRRLTKEQSASGHFGPLGHRLVRDPECTPIIKQMRDAVLRGEGFDRIAEKLNEDGVKPGPYASKKAWTGRMVRSLLIDPILRGLRRFRMVKYHQISRTGKYRRDCNAHAAQECFHAELAHLSDAEFDELQAAIGERRERFQGRNGSDNQTRGRPRSRSPWPGQVARCGVCGGLMHRMGRFLRCAGALELKARCWNKVQVPIALLNARTAEYLVGIATRFPRFRRSLANVAWTQQQRCGRNRGRSLATLEEQIRTLERQGANLLAGIKEGGKISMMVATLQEVQNELDSLQSERNWMIENPDCGEYRSIEDAESRVAEVLRDSIGDSLDLADLLRTVFKRLTIVPVGDLTSPQVRPRALLELDFARVPESKSVDTLDIKELSFSIDVFEPPVHVRLLDQVARLRSADPSLSNIELAKLLDVSDMSIKRTIAYSKAMRDAGSREPFRILEAPPPNASRWRRLPKDGNGDPGIPLDLSQ
jgi:hypothetical protein